MTLAEQGQIDLDAPVERYLTRWHLPAADSGVYDSEVTTRRLLSHTAGLSLHGYPGFDPDSGPLPTLEANLSGATNGAGDVHVAFRPGTRWEYSGGGFTILQLLVEERSGKSFVDYMRQAVPEANPAATPGSSGDGRRGAVANDPVVTGVFGLTDGDGTSLPTLFGGVPVDGPAQGGAGRGGTRDDGSGATAAVVNTTTDDRLSGSISVAPVGVVWADPIAVVAADFVPPDRDGVLGDMSRP